MERKQLNSQMDKQDHCTLASGFGQCGASYQAPPTPDKALNWVLQMHGGPRERGKQSPGTQTRNQTLKTQETP